MLADLVIGAGLGASGQEVQNTVNHQKANGLQLGIAAGMGAGMAAVSFGIGELFSADSSLDVKDVDVKAVKDVKMKLKILEPYEQRYELEYGDSNTYYYRHIKINLTSHAPAGGLLDRFITAMIGDDYSLSHSLFMRVDQTGETIIVNKSDFSFQNYGFLSKNSQRALVWGNNYIEGKILPFDEYTLKNAVSGPGRVLSADEYTQITESFEERPAKNYSLFGIGGGINCHMAISEMYKSIE